MKPISDPLIRTPDLEAWPILDYLRDELPGYCFDDNIDQPFVRELIADFPDTDILEELKMFRWCRNNEPFTGTASQRLVLRRWIARAARRDYRSRPW